MSKSNLDNFIFFTDSHIRLSNTKNRTDSMFDSQLTKLKWVIKRAEELKSVAIICGGDLGDIWDWKISLVNKVAEIFQSSSIPIYTIIGNHDVPGRNLSLWRDTGLGILDRMQHVTIIYPNIENIKFLDIGKFSVAPFHSDHPLTLNLIENKSELPPFSDKLKIAVIHAPVGPESSLYCKGYKDLEINGFDVALFGDIHDGWPVYSSPTGCKVCNPGSLTRLSKKDKDRIPKVAIVYSNGKVKYENVPCLDSNVCFDLSGMQLEKEKIGKGFLAALAAKKLQKEVDPKVLVEKVGIEAKFSLSAIKVLQDEIR